MIIQDLTKQFGKKNIPQIRPGDTVRISFKITEGGKTRLQTFEGICIAKKHGQTLNGSFTLRKVSAGIGVERNFPLHSPLITKIEKIKSRRLRRSKLYFLRDLVGKKAKKYKEKKDYKLWEEAISEDEIDKIEQEKRLSAKEKEKVKQKTKKEMEQKFAKAMAAHEQVKEEKGDISKKNSGERGGDKSSRVSQS